MEQVCFHRFDRHGDLNGEECASGFTRDASCSFEWFQIYVRFIRHTNAKKRKTLWNFLSSPVPYLPQNSLGSTQFQGELSPLGVGNDFNSTHIIQRQMPRVPLQTEVKKPHLSTKFHHFVPDAGIETATRSQGKE
jgi:hypothetical protein